MMTSVSLTFHPLIFHLSKAHRMPPAAWELEAFSGSFPHHTPTSFRQMTLPFLPPSVRSLWIWYLTAFLSFSVQILNINLFLEMFRKIGSRYLLTVFFTTLSDILLLKQSPLFSSLQINFILYCARIRVVYLAGNSWKVPDWPKYVTNREAIWENSLCNAHSQPMCSVLRKIKSWENGDLIGDI